MVGCWLPRRISSGWGWASRFALVTDGRFSGGTRGACIGHVSPEAAEEGRLPCSRNGDTIRIDLERRTLGDGRERGRNERPSGVLDPPLTRVVSGWLARYAKMVTSGSTGAVLKA